MTEIGAGAFDWCLNLASITLLNPTPPTFGINGINIVKMSDGSVRKEHVR